MNEPIEMTAAANLEKQVRERLGEKRLAALSKQPMCIARHRGMAAVLKAACEECAGHPEPVRAAAVRVLQLCGSVATAEDLKA